MIVGFGLLSVYTLVYFKVMSNKVHFETKVSIDFAIFFPGYIYSSYECIIDKVFLMKINTDWCLLVNIGNCTGARRGWVFFR